MISGRHFFRRKIRRKKILQNSKNTILAYISDDLKTNIYIYILDVKKCIEFFFVNIYFFNFFMILFFVLKLSETYAKNFFFNSEKK